MTPARPGASLRTRLQALVVGGVATVWLAAAAATWFDVREHVDALLDGHLVQAATLLAVQAAGEVAEGERTFDLPPLPGGDAEVAFQVLHEGRLVARSANAPEQPLLAAPQRAAGRAASVVVDGRRWRAAAAGDAHDADVQAIVAERVESRAAIVWAVLRATLGPLALALPVLALAAGWAVHRGLAPLRALGRALGERRPQALQPVTLADAPREIAPVVEALNALFARIAALLDGERRFTADAAHELRTPIAAIRAQAQVALGEPDAAARAQALRATLAGCDRAAHLVEQLLTLARLESGEARAPATVDLAALARQVAAELAGDALARRQALALEAPGPCPVHGDATLLAVLLRNLLDNALRYSPEGARIAVAVRRAGARVVASVEDGGPGMARADRERLGERFFRVLGSGASGSGLGWSIVRRIAAAHAAEVAVEPSALGGLAVRVSLDAAARSGETPGVRETSA